MQKTARYIGLIMLGALLTGSVAAPVAHAADHFFDTQAVPAAHSERAGVNEESVYSAIPTTEAHHCALCSGVAFASWFAQVHVVVPFTVEPGLLLPESSPAQSPDAGTNSRAPPVS